MPSVKLAKVIEKPVPEEYQEESTSAMENCPTGAIELVGGQVVLDDDKCIRCIKCTSHCPVVALKRVVLE